MANKYYTFISVNRKSIRIEETEQEHTAKVRKMRGIAKAQAEAEERKRLGWDGKTVLLCPECQAKIPFTKYVRSGNWYCKHCGYAPKTWTDGPKQ